MTKGLPALSGWGFTAMVSIFTGLGSGFERGSAAQLGSAGLLGSGTLGRSGEQLSVNAATGNLLINQRDEFLVGLGRDASVSRTYNSLGDPTHDDNGDKWQQSTDRRVYGLTGTLNATGSTVKRLSGDGTEITYTWNSTASAYVATDGAGAYDKLVQSGSGSNTTWTWTDGDSQIVETYSAYDPAHPSAPTNWRITSQADTSGNTLAFSYVTSSSRLDRITTQNGEYIAYVWDGSGNITDVVTHYGASNASTSTRTHYAYTSNKLTSVTVDLTPDDNSVTDGAKYVTTYAYDSNGRVSSITETDGSSMAIGYDGSGRVTSLTQTVTTGVTRVTSISYNSGYTTITDPLSQVTRLDYDSSDQLTKITAPVAVTGGTAQVTQFAYDSSGNVISVTDALGKVTSYTYDAPGNVLTATDPVGNVVTRTYDAHNRVLTETTIPAGTTSTTSGNLGPALLPNFTYWGGNETASAGTLTNGAAAYYYTGTSSGLTLQSVGVSVTAGDTITYELTLKAGTTSDAAAVDTSSGACSVTIVTGPGTITNGTSGSWADISGLSTTAETRIRVTRTVTTSGLDYLYFVAGASTLSGSARAGLTIVVGDPSIVRTTPAASTIQPTTRYSYDTNNRLEYSVSAEGRVTHHSYDSSGNDTADQIYVGGHYDVSALANGAALTSTQIATWVSGLSDKTQFQNIARAYDARGNLSTETEYSSDLSTGAADTSGGNKQTTYVYDQRGQLLSRTVNGLSTEHFVYDGLGRLVSSIDLNGATTSFAFNDSATQTVVTHANGLVETSVYNKAGDLLNTTDSLDTSTTSGNLGPNLSPNWVQWGGNQTGSAGTLANGAAAYYYTGTSSGPTLQSQGVAITAGDTLTYELTVKASSTSSTFLLGADSDPAGDIYEIVTGPGTVGPTGGWVSVSGLSTTLETRIRVTHHATASETAYLYVGVTAGQTIIIGDPSIVKTTPVAPRFQYDQDGQLRVATDKSGNTSYFVYDHAGRKVADVDQYGNMTEYRYDADNRVVGTVRYATAVSSTNITTYLQNPAATFELATIRPIANSNDLRTWKVFDDDGRMVEAIDGAGDVTTYGYDGFGRLVTTTAYANKLTSTQLSTITSTPPTSAVLPTADSAHDSVSRLFYDKDGQVVGTLNGEGYLTRTVYDDAGQKVAETAFATQITDTSLRATGTFAALVTAAGTAAADRTNHYVYNDQGQLRYEVDALGHLTEYNYRAGSTAGSEIGDVRTVTRYATALTGSFAYTMAGIAGALTTSSTNDRSSYAVYDTANRLAYAIDATGAVTSYGYDALGRVIRTTQFATTRTTSSLPDLSTMGSWATSNANANDRITRNFYDLRGELQYAVDAEGFITRFDYDNAGRQTATVRFDTVIGSTTFAAFTDSTTVVTITGLATGAATTVSTSYDHDGRVDTTTDGQGFITKFVYNANGTLASSYQAYSLADQVQTSFTYDNAGRTLTRTDAVGATEARVTTWVYDGLGDVVSVTDPAGNTTTSSYDHLGRKLSQTDPLGGATSWQYDAFGDAVKVTDPRTNASYAYYDNLGRVTATRDADDYVVETSYTAFGEVASVTQRANKATNTAGVATLPNPTADSARDETASYTYDRLGRVLTSTDAEGAVTTMTYNAFGQTATRVDPVSGSTTIQTTLSYDRRGLLKTQVVDSASGGQALTTSYGYDALGHQTLLTDANSHSTTRVYDRDGRLTSETNALSQTTSYAYDARGNLAAVTNALSAVTHYVYDKLDRRVATIDALGGVTTTTYDPDGRVTATRAYLNTVTVSGLPSVVTPATLTLPTANAADHITRYAYDADGRLRFTVDGLMHVTENVYDANGNVLHTIAYDGTIATDTSGVYATSWIATQVASLASAAGNRITRAVYDADNRQIYSIDAIGQVAWLSYDAEGNVIKRVEIAAPYTTAGDPSLATMDSWRTTNASATNDRVTRAFYDRDDRLVYSIDALGFVTRQEYDRLGHVTKQSRYADAYTATDTTTRANLDSNFASPPSTVRVTQFNYDSAGRLVETIDPQGFSTKRVLDAVGQVTSSTAAFGTADASVTSYSYDAVGRVLTETRGYGATEVSTTANVYDAIGQLTQQTVANGAADASVSKWQYDAVGRTTHATRGYGTSDVADTVMAYDTFGRLTSTTDPRGSVVSQAYDVLDEVLSQTAQMETGTTDDIVTAYTYDNFGNAVKTVDARGNASFVYYDKLDRAFRQVDAEKYVTDTSYTRGGQIASVKRWANALTGTIVETTVPSNPTADTSHDATTSFTYDKRDQVTATQDAEGFTESYTLDAFGERVTVRNKLGNDTTYTFDKRGLVLSETLPITTKTSAGATISVINTYAYDGRGNRKQMVEAAGAAEARTTTYSYDKLDRLTVTGHDAVTIVNDDLTSTSGVAITEQVKYDRRGNVIESIDAAGAHTLRWYDALDRQIAEVVQTSIVSGANKGTLTRFTYDANGNVTSSKIYGDLITLPSDATGSVPTPVDSSKFHETLSSYDRANRLISTTVASLLTGESTGTSTFALTTGNVVSTLDYDKSGNVVHQQDGRGNNVYSWYDKLGRKTAEVDAETYLTVWTRDAEGNALSETRYATAVGSFTVGSTPPSVSANANDRTTMFVYDRDGRRIEERRLAVAYTSISATGVATDVAATDSTAVSKINYTYNGLGQVLSKTEANIADITVSTTARDTVGYAYDAIGRLVLETGQAFKDYLWTSGAANATPLTAYVYDGLNNLKSTRVQMAATANDTNDRITSYTYGAGGRVATMTDATGFTHTYGYDKVGRTILDSYVRVKADGTTVTEGAVTRYDLAGHMIMQTNARLSGGTWSFTDETIGHVAYDAIWMRYDAYGQMTGRGRTGGAGATPVYQEVFDYDAAGRLWHTNTGDGADHFYIYDKAGNQTLELTSTGADLSALTLANYTGSITSAGGTTTSNAVTTITLFDKRGKQIGTRQPDRLLATGGSTTTITSAKTYNAFGEVTSETDARGYTTSYTYNNMGRLSSKVLPQVSVTAENGSQSNVNPTEYYGYDLSGRLVSVLDANGHRNTRLLLAGSGHGDREALITKEFHPDSGIVATRYDVFGDARTTTNEVGSVESKDYDKVGRLITQTHAARPIGSVGNTTGAVVQLVDHFVYDGLGQRTGHWNSQFGSSYLEKSDFDVQGRVTSTANFAGEATNYTYSWNASAATTGLGTFGGWTRTTSNIGTSQIASESRDYFGRIVDQVDFGNHNYDFTFDKGGRLTARTNEAGESIAYTYYNTGLIAGQTGTQGTATYQYDEAGNRLLETFAKGGTTWRNDIASYDALGRMTTWTDRDASNTTISTTAWEYDAVGNVRRSKASYHAVNADGTLASTTSVQDYWYLYDTMNRFTLTKGQLSGIDSSYQSVTGDAARGIGTIGRGHDGTAITYYLDGNRATALYTASLLGTRWVYYGNGNGNYQNEIVPDGTGTDGTWTQVTYRFQGDRREDYVYTADGYLARTAKADAYMDAGAQPQPTDQGAPEPTYVAPPTTGGTLSTITRDALGRIIGYIEQGGFDGSFERSSIIYDFAGRELSETSITIRRDTTGGPSQTYTTYTTNTFVGGLQTEQLQHTYKNSLDSTGDSAVPDSKTFYSYDWWDGALQKTIGNDNDNSGAVDWTTTNTFDASGHIIQANIVDGQPRNVNFVTDQNGQIIDRLEAKLSGNTTSAGNPHTIHYNFGGVQMGEVGNNGTDNIDYAASIANRLRPNPGSPSPFASGEEYYSPLADFDQSYDAINGSSTVGTGSGYTVANGDTLLTIAQAVWGDSALWYLIADANGLTGSETLAAGRVLNIPNKVHNSHNTSSTWRPYDPNEALGDVNPTAAPQPPKRNSCGIFGQILVLIVAVVASHFLGPVLGDLVKQGFANLIGVQHGFSWKELAIAEVTFQVSQGIDVSGVFDGIGNSFVQGAVTQATANAVTQGISVATHLQDKFDFAGVAAAGVAGGISQWAGPRVGASLGSKIGSIGVSLIVRTAAAVGSAATRSLIEGSDFGDNILAGLPDVLVSSIGDHLGPSLWDRVFGEKDPVDHTSEKDPTRVVSDTKNPYPDPPKPIDLRDADAIPERQNYDLAPLLNAAQVDLGEAPRAQNVADVSQRPTSKKFDKSLISRQMNPGGEEFFLAVPSASQPKNSLIPGVGFTVTYSPDLYDKKIELRSYVDSNKFGHTSFSVDGGEFIEFDPRNNGALLTNGLRVEYGYRLQDVVGYNESAPATHEPTILDGIVQDLRDAPIPIVNMSFNDLQRSAEQLKYVVTTASDATNHGYQIFRDWDDRHGNVITRAIPGGPYALDFAEAATHTVINGLAATPDGLLHPRRSLEGAVNLIGTTGDNLLRANDKPALVFLNEKYQEIRAMSGREIATSVGDKFGTLVLVAGPAKFAPEASFVGGEGNLGAQLATRESALAADSVPAGYTRAYRAVSHAEFDDIVATGRFNQGPNSLEGKWFADHYENVLKHGDGLEGAGNYRVVVADLPDNAPSLYRVPNLDGRGPARFLHMDDLQGVTPKPYKPR
jgi:YD repeat-containing protein